MESGIYEIFRVLDVQTLNEELSTFEQMFTNINARIQEDEFLQNVLEVLTLQNLPIPPKPRKNRAIKKSKYKAKARDQEGETEAPAKTENGHAATSHGETPAGEKPVTTTETKSTPRKRQRSKKLEDSVTKEDQVKQENKEKKKRLRLRKRTKPKPKTISQIIESLVVPNPNKPAVEVDLISNTKGTPTHPPVDASDTLITLRKKQTGNALNYNLRGEIKVNSKSKFDFLHDFSAPKKHKTKAVADSNKLLTTEE